MHEIKGTLDHNLRLRTSMGKGDFGEIKFHSSCNIDGAAIFIEFEECPNVMFRLEELVRYTYELLENEGYVKDGKHTGKKYSISDYIKKKFAESCDLCPNDEDPDLCEKCVNNEKD